ASPALLKRMSRPPSCSTACSTKRSQLCGSITSSSSATSVSSRSTRRAPPATSTPAAASAAAVAFPIPDDAPVTIAVLPASSTRVDANRLPAPRDVVDLQRGVLEVEAVDQHPPEAAPHAVAVDVGRDENVGGQGGEAVGHGPHVEVVHLDDVVVLRQRLRDRCRIDPGGRGLE